MERLVMKTIAMMTATMLALPAHAVLQSVDDLELSTMNGQASPAVIAYDTGAPKLILGLDLRLNLDPDGTIGQTDGTLGAADGSLDNICPSGQVACNIGIAFNNRYSSGNKKDWLVFKNVTGSISIPHIDLTGQLVNVSSTGTANNRSALALRIEKTNPIVIKQLGFESLAVETDSAAEVVAGGALNGSNVAGYRNNALAAPLGDTNNVFDAGKFRGFVGLDITASLAVNGTFKIYNCVRDVSGCK